MIFIQKSEVDLSKGFTLIELMIVVFILAILAAIAVPTYRSYAISNIENDTKASMKQLQLDLNRWRASALTYQGFEPKNGVRNGEMTYGYNNADNTLIYLPFGSDSSNYLYQVMLVDGQQTSQSLVYTGTGVDNVTGRTWRMLAIPKSSGITTNAKRILLTSTGLQCENTSNSLTIDSTGCEIGGNIW